VVHDLYGCLRLNDLIDAVTKSKKEVAAMKAEHAAKQKLRKERREEQERNVQRKKAKANDGDALGSDEDDSLEGDEDDDGVGVWDDEEDISDGEGSGVDGSDEDGSESDVELEERPPAKKVRIRGE
jgi:ribosome biogenesis protein SSF1/2